MKSKILMIFIIILTLFLSVSLVSASENVSDVSGVGNLDEIVELDEEFSSQVLNDNPSGDNNKSQTNINASDVSTYSDVEDVFVVKLTSNNTSLADKPVKIILNNITYENITDANGEVRISFKLNVGNYSVEYFFFGDENYTASNGTSTIIVNDDIATYLNVVNGNIKYVAGSISLLQLRLTDINNNTLSGNVITITLNGKSYYAITDSNGIASFNLNLKEGTYTIFYSFSKTSHYIGSSGSVIINVKPKLTNGNGYWVNKWDMKKVNLKKLAKKGTKHIFLQHTAFSKYGKSAVVKWIKKAHKYGMKVHIWIAVFYKNGKYVHASSKKGKINYKHMNKIIKKAKYYASIEGVDGIHFDYIRFGGNAYKYKNAVKAINHFVKTANSTLRSVNPNIILSAAVMPEPSAMKHNYGQDIPTMSKYFDVIIPMIYKGNYHASSKWIKKTTKKFVKMSKGAKIWAGLQTYKSDSKIKKLSYKSLFKDAKAAKKGGAAGVVLFRWGITKFINFNKL